MKVIISDRNYIGVLAFTSALQALGWEVPYNEFFDNEVDWFGKSMREGRLVCPELLLILALPPRMSQLRQPFAADFDPAFGDLNFLQAMSDCCCRKCFIVVLQLLMLYGFVKNQYSVLMCCCNKKRSIDVAA